MGGPISRRPARVPSACSEVRGVASDGDPEEEPDTTLLGATDSPPPISFTSRPWSPRGIIEGHLTTRAIIPLNPPAQAVR